MPKIELLPPGEMRLYRSIQGPVLLNFKPATSHHRDPIQLSADDNGVLWGCTLPGEALKILPLNLGPFGFLENSDFRPGKYVRFNDDRLALFPDEVTHANVPGWIDIPDRARVISAGFVEICTAAPADMGVLCYGESYSLCRASRGREDADRVARMIGLQHFSDD